MRDYGRNILKQAFNHVEVIEHCANLLLPKMFPEKNTQGLWEIFKIIHKQNLKLSLSTVEDTIKKHDGDKNFIAFFHTIIESEYQDEQEWKYHVSYLIEEYRKNELSVLAEYINDNIGLSSSFEIADVINKTIGKIDDTNNDEYEKSSAIDETVSELKKIQKGELSFAYDCGIDAINRNSPICRGYQILWSGSSGCGKTALAIQLMINLMERNDRLAVQFFSLEMKMTRLMRRVISNRLEITEDEMVGKNGFKLSGEQIKQINQLSKEIKASKNYNFEIYDREGDIHNIIRKAKKFVRKYDNYSHIIILDNIDKVKVIGSDSNTHHNLVSQEMLSLKNALDCTNILIHHQTKETEKDESNDRRPTKAGIRGSAKLADDADVIWLIYRPDAYPDVIDKYPGDVGKLIIDVVKYRDGDANFDIEIKHKIQFNQFTDV